MKDCATHGGLISFNPASLKISDICRDYKVIKNRLLKGILPGGTDWNHALSLACRLKEKIYHRSIPHSKLGCQSLAVIQDSQYGLDDKGVVNCPRY